MPFYLSMHQLVGRGYANGWWTNFKGRYRIYASARNTKKSYVIIGLEILDKIISDPRRNVLVLRWTSSSNRESTFNTLKMLISTPNINDPSISLNKYFKINESNMKITYKPTGQVIMFGGFYPDPTRLTSLRMATGHLTDVYVEEAFEIKSWEDWRKVDGTIRGKLPEGLFHQITFCLNPWNESHWINDHFFKKTERKDTKGNLVITGMEDSYDILSTRGFQDYKNEDVIIDYGKGLYLHKASYLINEFRDKEIYDLAMKELERVAPEIYKVEGLGMWGNTTDATYPEFNDSLVITPQDANTMHYAKCAIGIDFGISDGEGRAIKTDNDQYKSATTMQLVGVTSDFNKLVAIDEYFWSNEGVRIKKTGPEIQNELIDKIIEWKNKYIQTNPQILGFSTILVYVDSADSGGFRQGLQLIAKQKGLYNIIFQPSTKLRIQSRVDFSRLLMAFGDCLYSSNCPNLIRETKNSNRGDEGKVRSDINDHCLNAWEYGWAAIVGYLKKWKNFKEH